MTFTDEQKQVEFEAFSAYYTLVSKRPITSATRSLLQQLRAIAIGQFGNGAFQELVRANRTETQQKTEVRLGKQSGGGLSRERRNQSPEQQPRSMSPDRAARLAKREAQKSRSEAPAVVAAAVGGAALALGVGHWWPLVPLAMYATAIVASVATATGVDIRTRLALLAVLPTMHFSWGLGFWKGVFVHRGHPAALAAARAARSGSVA